MSKISVVVPIYNVEKYIHKCLDSILNNSFKNIEVILVDDGSLDSCPAICDEYAKNDNRIIVIHKKNGGLSSARNAGIKAANGEYICFIDSDDYIDSEMFSHLYNNLNSCDMSTCGVYNVYGENAIPQCDDTNISFVCNNEQAFGHNLVGKLIPGTICNKLIKTEIAKQIDFPVGKLYEDAFYTNKLIPLLKTVSITTKPMYYYYHRENSITTKQFNENHMDIVHAFYESVMLCKEKYPNIIKQANFKYTWANFTVLDMMLKNENYKAIPQYSIVVKFLKQNTFKVVFSKYFRPTRKIASIMLLINVRLYRFLVLKNS